MGHSTAARLSNNILMHTCNLLMRCIEHPHLPNLRWDYHGMVVQRSGSITTLDAAQYRKSPPSIRKWRRKSEGTLAVMATAFVSKSGSKVVLRCRPPLIRRQRLRAWQGSAGFQTSRSNSPQERKRSRIRWEGETSCDKVAMSPRI